MINCGFSLARLKLTSEEFTFACPCNNWLVSFFLGDITLYKNNGNGHGRAMEAGAESGIPQGTSRSLSDDNNAQMATDLS